MHSYLSPFSELDKCFRLKCLVRSPGLANAYMRLLNGRFCRPRQIKHIVGLFSVNTDNMAALTACSSALAAINCGLASWTRGLALLVRGLIARHGFTMTWVYDQQNELSRIQGPSISHTTSLREYRWGWKHNLALFSARDDFLVSRKEI